MTQNLGRNQRIRKKSEFKLLFDKAKPVRGKFFVLWILSPTNRSEKAKPRCAFMVSKKVHSRAVVRNLWKRRMREAFRRNQARFSPGIAVLLKAKGEGKPPLYCEIEAELLMLLGKQGYIQ